MKKVALATCYFKNNYGSALQAYANQFFLDENNIENETIDISKNVDFKNGKKKYYASQLFNFAFIQQKFGMIKFQLYQKINPTLKKNVSIRNKCFEEFKTVFRLTEPYVTYDDLNNYAKNAKAVIVGSDQLWLPVNVVADYYTLNWCPENTKKISYATSFGISSIPEKYAEQYKAFLSRINHLSVREIDGQTITEKVAGVKSEIVCDPTLLLTKEQWDDFSYGKKAINEKKYILCYFLGNNIAHRKFVERLKKQTGYEIVSLNHCDEFVKYSETFCDEAPYNVGPREWVNLVKNAQFVCTDSFHASVFSIIFNKDFFCFRRHASKNKNSTNSRLDSLLEKAQIDKSRILTGEETNIESLIAKKVDWKKTNAAIAEFRTRSQKWLLDAIKGGKEEK